MAFLDDAKEILVSEDFTKLQFLNQKSANFETTSDEEGELHTLKQKVRNGIATRDRAKNLAFLQGKTYSAVEVLKAGGYTAKEVKAAIKEIFGSAAPSTGNGAPAEAVAKYKVKGGGEQELSLTGRLTPEMREFLKSANPKSLIAGLTEFGKKWAAEFTVPTQGPYSGKHIYNNLNTLAKRVGKDKAALMKELGIKTEA